VRGSLRCGGGVRILGGRGGAGGVLICTSWRWGRYRYRSEVCVRSIEFVVFAEGPAMEEELLDV
jgi:hypothetical protein